MLFFVYVVVYNILLCSVVVTFFFNFLFLFLAQHVYVQTPLHCCKNPFPEAIGDTIADP